MKSHCLAEPSHLQVTGSGRREGTWNPGAELSPADLSSVQASQACRNSTSPCGGHTAARGPDADTRRAPAPWRWHPPEDKP